MLTQFQRKKMVALFAMFDADRNGAIEQKDFDQVAGNLADARKMKAGSAEHTKLVDQYRAAWKALHKMADADGDGSITSDEWMKAVTTLVGSEKDFTSVVTTLANLVFDTFDADRDDFVTSDEFGAFVKARQVPNASPAVAFKRMDTDGDGKLSRADVIRLTGEYFKSDDPAAAGNALFGQV
jgi:Ca2+-binding EF-hand superfamily protein